MDILKNKNYNIDSPIGFFDSGVGGLSVLKEVKKLLPNESFIFYGDTAHVPYGDKSKEQLLDYSSKILSFFEKKKCKAVVMACNTTSSLIYNDIKNNYDFKLYPVVQSVAKIISEFDVDRIGVFATKATILSGAYENEISKYNPKLKVFGQYCSDWVKIVENNLVNDANSIKIIKHDLDLMLANSPEKIVLGCTHYPYLLGVLSDFAPENLFIDPAKYLANYIKDDLQNMGLLSKNSNRDEEYYVSSNPEKFSIAAKMFYELQNEPLLYPV